MNEPEQRKTALSWVEPDGITIRGYPVEQLTGRVSFGEAIYLLLRGELPEAPHARMLEAVLVSVLDHGVSAPSTLAAVTVATTGAELNAAVAAGLCAISRYHGGAIEDSMRALEACVKLREEENLSAEEAANRFVLDMRQQGERVSGFGHRIHGGDPRAARLFQLARELELASRYVEQAEVLERVLSERTGRRLPINADGAIAAVLCEMRFPPRLANGIFMIARVAGLVAHVTEEQERNRPMRTVDPKAYEYDGASRRSLLNKDEAKKELKH